MSNSKNGMLASSDNSDTSKTTACLCCGRLSWPLLTHLWEPQNM